MKYILFIFCICLITSCKTNHIKNNKRVGLWITTDTLDGNVYKSKGKYRKGTEVKTWKYFKDNHLYKREIYKDSTSKITFYHDNGLKMKEGLRKLTLDGKYLHWHYDGYWREFDTLGNQTKTILYDNGTLVN